MKRQTLRLAAAVALIAVAALTWYSKVAISAGTPGSAAAQPASRSISTGPDLSDYALRHPELLHQPVYGVPPASTDDPLDEGTLLPFRHYRDLISADDPMDMGTLLPFRHFQATLAMTNDPIDEGTLLPFRHYQATLVATDDALDVGTLLAFRHYRAMLSSH